MLRTEILVQEPQNTSKNSPTTASGLCAIDPADFKFIGGGAPRGGWLGAVVGNGLVLSEDSSTSVALGVAAPRGGW